MPKVPSFCRYGARSGIHQISTERENDMKRLLIYGAGFRAKSTYVNLIELVSGRRVFQTTLHAKFPLTASTKGRDMFSDAPEEEVLRKPESGEWKDELISVPNATFFMSTQTTNIVQPLHGADADAATRSQDAKLGLKYTKNQKVALLKLALVDELVIRRVVVCSRFLWSICFSRTSVGSHRTE